MPLDNPQEYDKLSTPELQGVVQERMNAFMGKFGEQSDAMPLEGDLPPGVGEDVGVPSELEGPAGEGDSAEDALGGILASGVTDPVDIIAALQERGFEVSKSLTPPGEGAEATPEEALAVAEPSPEEVEVEEEGEADNLPPMVRARRKAAKNASDKANKGGEAA